MEVELELIKQLIELVGKQGKAIGELIDVVELLSKKVIALEKK